MRKLKKSELKRVYGGDHDNGRGKSNDQIHTPGDTHLDPHTSGSSTVGSTT